MEKLTIQEEEAMLIVWDLGKGFIKDFLEKFPDPKPPYTTLASVVKKLETKGFLESTKMGNTYYYLPKIPKSEYKRKFMSSFVKEYFEDSYQDLVSFFVENKKLTPDELKTLLSLIEKEK